MIKAKPISNLALAGLLNQAGRHIHSQAHSDGLFPAQWAALRYLAAAAEQQRTATALAHFQGMAFGPVSRTVRTLILKGLVRKSGQIGRSREEILSVTSEGIAMLERDPLKRIAAALENLSSREKEHLAVALERVLLSLQGVDPDDETLFD